MPNFFIVGAPKCGTTSLAIWLAEHPNIYMSPIKEPRFFSPDIGQQAVQTEGAYARLFDKVCDHHVAIGEASTTYLLSTVAVPAIEARFPAARYIVMGRNPVEMAYSLHRQLLYTHDEDVADFRTAWLLSQQRANGEHIPGSCRLPTLLDYQSVCALGEQLQRLYDCVAADRVLVLILDDIKEDPAREYLRVLEFLGVPDDGRDSFLAHNEAKAWRHEKLGSHILRAARVVASAKNSLNLLPKRTFGLMEFAQRIATRDASRSPLPADLRAELQDFFEEDICRLEELLDRDFPTWHQVKAQ